MAFENTIQERGVTALWAESCQLRYKFTKEQEEELKGYRKERERLIRIGFAQASIKAKRLEKDKIFFITDFDTYTSEEKKYNDGKKYVTYEEVGGATSWNTGFGMLCKAALYPSKYKVCIHEFAHFLHVPDATKQQKKHPDEIYFLKSEENYDNIMYYKDYFHVKNVIDKRWFFYQMKRAYNDWDTYGLCHPFYRIENMPTIETTDFDVVTFASHTGSNFMDYFVNQKTWFAYQYRYIFR